MSAPRRFLERSLLLGLLLGAVVIWAVAPASAQTGAPTPLRLDSQELERELGAAREQLGELPEGRQAALLLNRINAIEEQLRQLTGRIEEAEFRDQQTQTRIDRLVADLDRRLAALDHGGPVSRPEGDGPETGALLGMPGAPVPGAQGAAPESPATATPVTGPVAGDGAMPEVTTGQPATRPGPAVEPDPAARDGFVLGTIPRDALLGIPQPSTEPPAGTAPAAALQGNAAGRFTAALDLLQTGDYSAAEVAFDRWVADFPDDPQAPVAAFWLGEAQLANGDLANAAATFAANYRTFGAEAPRAADNLLKLGTALAAMGDTSRACQTFAEMDRRYREAGSGLRQALERERRAAGCS